MLRLADQTDATAIGQLIFDCVRTGPSPYTEAQRRAWMPEPRTGPDWQKRLAGQRVILSIEQEQLNGLMSLDPETGYIDFAYIRPDARGKGLFRKLYERIETEAEREGVRRLWVHASLMAEPAFTAMAFDVVEREEVAIGDQTLKRAIMEKYLRQSS